jgi:diguanylate cyclase (GGDEF)-like protein
MLGAVRRSIGRKLLLAVGAPALAVALAGMLWLRHEARLLAPGVEPMHQVAIGALVALGIAMAVTHLVAVRFFLERPLRRLSAGMRRAREGDFLARVPVEGEDELAALARSYNETLAAITDLHVRRIEDAASIAAMQRELLLKAELEWRVKELTTLYELGRALRSTLDQDEVVAAVASSVGRALGDAEVEVLLADDATDELVVRGVSGLGDAAVGSRIPAGASRPGATMVPMRRGEETVGAIAVRRRSGALGEEELRLLDALASQSAMAVANAGLHRRLVRLSQTDALTGAHNRRSLFARLDAELERSARFEHTTALALVDVDHFRRYNEALGHGAGDAVLRDVARLLGAAVRKVDLVARYGGEEFAIVLTRADRAAAVTAAEKLRGAIAAAAIPHPAGEGGRVTISVGVAVFPHDGRDLGALIDCADAALYAAKRAGRNAVVAYEPGMRVHPGRKRDARTTAQAEPDDEKAAG